MGLGQRAGGDELRPTGVGDGDNFKAFKQTYPGKSASLYSCKTCHQHAIGRKGDLNPYGASLQKAVAPGTANKLTEANFQAVEKEDADSDGVSNLDEINAGTNPGDPASVPAKGGADQSQTK